MAQDLFDDYVKEFGFAPKQPNHLIAYSKKKGKSIRFGDARKVLNSNKNSNENNNKQTQKPKQIPKVKPKPKPFNKDPPPNVININIQNKPKPPPQLQPRPPQPPLTTSITADTYTSSLIKTNKANAKKQIINNNYNVKPLNNNAKPKPPPPPPAYSLKPPSVPRSLSADNVPRTIANMNAKYEEKKSDTQSSKQTFQKKKKSDKTIINPIFCRVDFECSSIAAKTEIYEALKSFVNIQLKENNAGVIMYHFTCPNLVKYPLKLEFTEIYLNEEIYWIHAKSKQFVNAYLKAFKDKNMKSRTFITIGTNKLSEMVRKMNAQSDSQFPTNNVGYLMHSNYAKALDYTDETQILLKFSMVAPNYYKGKRENVKKILDFMKQLSVFAKQSYAITFHAHRLSEKTCPDQLELISVWPNEQCLIEFLQNAKVQFIMSSFQKFVIKQTDLKNRKDHFVGEIYGKHVNDHIGIVITQVFDEIGYVRHIDTDIGYIVHPNASSDYL